MEKNRAQAKEIKNLKLEQESQAILWCDVAEQKEESYKRQVHDWRRKNNFSKQIGGIVIRAI